MPHALKNRDVEKFTDVIDYYATNVPSTWITVVGQVAANDKLTSSLLQGIGHGCIYEAGDLLEM